jgi:hypothetical protein
MYKIFQFDYHYYSQLTDQMDVLQKQGFEIMQVIEIGPSGNNERMHRATVLCKQLPPVDTTFFPM